MEIVPLNLPQRGMLTEEQWAEQLTVSLQNWSEQIARGIGLVIDPDTIDVDVVEGKAEQALQQLRDLGLALSSDPAERAKVILPVIRSLRDDVDLMQKTIMQMFDNQERLGGALMDAGLIIESDKGHAEIYAFRQIENQFQSVQVNLDALQGQIDLIATVGETGDLSGLITAITTVQIELDALEGTLTSFVQHGEFDVATARLTTAETRLDAVEGELELRITEGIFNAALARITDVETELDILTDTGGGSITNKILDVVAKSPEVQLTWKTLSDVVQQMLINNQLQYSEFAFARDKLYANADQQGVAIATHTLELVAIRNDVGAEVDRLEAAISDGDTAIATIAVAAQAVAGNTQAQFISEQTLRSNQYAATASSITSLTSRADNIDDAIGDIQSAITVESDTRADQDSALASQITTVSTTVAGHTSTLAVQQASINGMSLQYSIVGTIDGVTGGIIFQGLKKNDGSPANFLTIFNSNVVINGNLIVTGTVNFAQLTPNAATQPLIAETSGSAVEITFSARGGPVIILGNYAGEVSYNTFSSSNANPPIPSFGTLTMRRNGTIVKTMLTNNSTFYQYSSFFAASSGLVSFLATLSSKQSQTLIMDLDTLVAGVYTYRLECDKPGELSLIVLEAIR